MKAVGLYHYLPVDHAECFVDVELDQPVPTQRELLVRVQAVSLNPVDTKIRAPKPDVETEPRILGWDASGTVEAVGDGCTLFNVGDTVFYAGSITRPGCNSEYHLVDERIVGRKPTNLSHEEAAALPLTALTAWEGFFERMGIVPEKTADNANASLLIIAGAGGVGSIATQLAKTVAGIGTVITTASRPETEAWCKEMGADHVINHHNPLKEGLQSVGLDGVDYIFCCYDTDAYFEQMVDVIKPQGAICLIVTTKDNQPVNINPLQGKSVRLCWELMFTKSIFMTDDMESQHHILNNVASLIESGQLRTTLTEIDGDLNAKNLIAAHKKIESGKTIGKLVLTVP